MFGFRFHRLNLQFKTYIVEQNKAEIFMYGIIYFKTASCIPRFRFKVLEFKYNIGRYEYICNLVSYVLLKIKVKVSLKNLVLLFVSRS